jgi:hypothetical protein
MTTAISDRQLEIIEAAGKILTASGVSGLTIKNLAMEMKFSESANHPKKNSQRCFKINFHFLKRTLTL